jgi:hypothetical protein
MITGTELVSEMMVLNSKLTSLIAPKLSTLNKKKTKKKTKKNIKKKEI